MAHDRDVDAIYIASPNALHAPQAIECLAAGKHVLVDKPLATSVGDAAHMLDAARRADRRLGVMHQQRFHPANRQLLDLLRNDALGALQILRIQIAMWLPIENDWRNDAALSGGGVLMDLGSHALDLMLQAAGALSSISAETRILRPRHRLEDFCRATLEFASGAVGLLELTYCAHHYGGRIEAFAENGALLVDGSMQAAKSYRTTLRIAGEDPIHAECNGLDCHELALTDFTQALLAGAEPTLSADDGMAALQAIVSLYESARTGMSAALPTPAPET